MPSFLAPMRRHTRMLAALLTLFVGAIAVAAFYGLPRSPDTTRQPNFLVIDIDVYAWDHVGVVREGVSNTPNLDALAARGVRFTQAFSHSGWTLPALSSLLSGALPVPGRAESRGIPWFPTQTQVLPEILSYYGYATVAFFGYGVAGSAPFQARFQHVDVTDVPPGAPKPDPPTDHVLAFLADAPSPFFALVHDANLHNVHLYCPIPPIPPATRLLYLYARYPYLFAPTGSCPETARQGRLTRCSRCGPALLSFASAKGSLGGTRLGPTGCCDLRDRARGRAGIGTTGVAAV